MPRAALDLRNKIFGRLTTLKIAGRTRSGDLVWLCRCSCKRGRLANVIASALKSGRTKSCGCFRRDHPGRLIHGMEGSREYSSWCAMKSRCSNRNLPFWRHYGGRGIRVCARWRGKHGFLNFYADMGPRPRGTTLDRRENDGNYTPDNSRWATRSQQNKNQRRSVA